MSDPHSDTLHSEQEYRQLQAEKESQEALYRIIQLLLEPISLNEKLDRTLEILFRVPWFRVEHKGAIFLADNQTQTLHIHSKQHLTPELHSLCDKVPFGYCLCGRAASERKLVYCNHLDERHDQRFSGMKDHGHYCQPIMAEGELLGVLNLYVTPDHLATQQELSFVQAVSTTMAGMITNERIKEGNQRLADIIEETPDCVAIVDQDGRLTYTNATARKVMGLPDGANSKDYTIEQLAQRGSNCFDTSTMEKAQERGIWQAEGTLRPFDGSEEIPVTQTMIYHQSSCSDENHFSVIAHDISAQKRAESAALNAAVREQYFANVLINGLPGIFYLLNHEHRLIRWNDNLMQVTGYSQKELTLMPQSQLFSESELAEIDRATMEALTKGATSFEVGVRTKFGARIPYFINGLKIDSISGAELSMAGIGVDISYRKELELELKRRATTDGLTGVSNRSRMEEIISYQLIQNQRYGNPFAVIMIDIDKFKQVNDTHGHDIGDEVLITLVQIARGVLRESDVLARWGGEEFVVMIPESNQADAQLVAEKLRLSIYGSPFPHRLRITASFGVAEAFPNATIRTLVKKADDAMYVAKGEGRNRVCYWDGKAIKTVEY